MPPVVLGLFSTILNWLLDNIFAPIFNFIARILGIVFEWIFKNILAPIIEFALEAVFPLLWDLLMTVLGGLLYQILALLLGLVDIMQSAFDILIGIAPVTYTNAAGVKITDQTLLEALFNQPVIGRTFIFITALGVALAFLFAIFATARSAFDLEGENKRPVSAVLKAGFKAGITFMLIPLMVLIMLQLSGVILTTVTTSINYAQSGSTALQKSNQTTSVDPKESLGNTIFLISSLNAAKDGKFNTAPSFTDNLRMSYYTGAKSYTSYDTVKNDFVFKDMDFLVGFGAGIMILFILAKCLIVFVQRIFDIILMYIVSPLFVSTMPLDDGAYFSKWREMFIGKVFTGFGTAIAMRIYLMMVPLIMGDSIDFTAGGMTSSEMNYIIKLIIVLGGAWAVDKSGNMITQLLSSQAAQSEQATSAAAGRTMMAGAMMGSRLVGRGIGFAAGKLGDHSKGQDEFDSTKDKLDAGNKFGGGAGAGGGAPSGGQVGSSTGSRPAQADTALRGGADTGVGTQTGRTPPGQDTGDQAFTGGADTGTGTQTDQTPPGQDTGDQAFTGGEPPALTGGEPPAPDTGSPADTEVPADTPDAAPLAGAGVAAAAASSPAVGNDGFVKGSERRHTFMGFGYKTSVDPSTGKSVRSGIKLGPLTFNSKLGPDGQKKTKFGMNIGIASVDTAKGKFSVLGVQFKKDQNGKTRFRGVGLPGVNIKTKIGADGKQSLERFKMPGIKLQRDGDKKMRLDHLNVLGLAKRDVKRDAHGRVTSESSSYGLGSLGFKSHTTYDSDGKVTGGGFKVPFATFTRQESGQTKLTHLGRKNGGRDFAYRTDDDGSSKLAIVRSGNKVTDHRSDYEKKQDEDRQKASEKKHHK